MYAINICLQYFPNLKASIVAGTQIEDDMNNGTIKTNDLPRFRKNLGSNSMTIEVSNIHKNDPYQLIAPVQVPQGPRPKREFHELYLPMGQVFDKLKAKGLLKPIDLRPIPNPLPSGFDMNKRCSYHQVPGYDTDRCLALRHAI